MDGKVTVDVKSVLFAALVLLGLVAAYLVGSAGDSPGTSAAAVEEGDAAPRSVLMTGTGRATTVPDELSFSVSVAYTRTDVEDALAESSRTMAALLKALKPYGVAKKDTETTGLSIDPQYRYHQYSEPEITGYRVGESARITVPDLGKAGKAISATVAAGGNAVRVRAISLGISDREAVLEEARDAAVEQATTKAEQYAAATGQQLGDVLTLKEVRATRPVSYPTFGRMAYDELAAKAVSEVPIRAGEEELAVTVQVVWSFE